MKLCIFLIFMFAMGCATSRTISVDAMSARKTAGAKVYIEDRSKSPELEKQYFTSYVESAMVLAGYQPVPKPSEADYFVYFNYLMSSQEKIGSSPTYQWVAPKNYNYTSNTFNGYGSSYRTSGNMTESGTGHLEQTGNQVYSYTAYTTAMIISCYDAKEVVEHFVKQDGQPAREVWTTKMASSDIDGDMRKDIPLLLSAGMKYFGRDTGGLVQEAFRKPSSELVAQHDKGK